MNSNEKAFARVLFQNKISKADGNAFEDLFTEIMNYAESGFQQIKPWGNIGDRKNDGYINDRGIFYQVFAPEDIRKSYPDAVDKLVEDFDGLRKQWSPIHEFYFVVNDKYNGINADCEKALKKIIADYNLKNAGLMTAKDLENQLFSLSDDQIIKVVSFLPDPQSMRSLDFNVVNEVVAHIMQLPLNVSDESYIAPDWDKKIEFNGLSEKPANYLNAAYFQVGGLEEYLKNNGDFLAEELKNRMRSLYISKKENRSGDELFMYILSEASPKTGSAYQNAVLVIMAKYFEACDIFEEPPEE